MTTSNAEQNSLNNILAWCTSVLGKCEVVTTDLRFHGRTTVFRLRTSASSHCYVKMHRQRSTWETEVHAYER